MIGQDPLQRLSNGSYHHAMVNNKRLNTNERFNDNNSSDHESRNNGSKERHKRSTETSKPRRSESTLDSHIESNDMVNVSQNENENENDGSNQDTTSETPKPPRRRSKQGCLTCKIRKKRCDEMKPTCGDCTRLGRRCEYITEDMSSEQIKILKFEMESLEEDSKARRRKPRPKKSLQGENGLVDINNGTKKANGERKHHNDYTHRNGKKRRKVQDDDKVVFNPLALDMINIEKVYTPMSTVSQIDGVPAPAVLPSTGMDLKQQVNNHNNKINRDHNNHANNNNIWESFLDNNQMLPSPLFNPSFSPKLKPTSNPSNQIQLQYNSKYHEQRQQQQQQQLQNSIISSYPLSSITLMSRTNSPSDDMDSLTQIFSPAISAFFQNHLQKDTQGDDNIVKAREQPAYDEKQEAIMAATTNDVSSSKNNIPSEVIRQLQELFEFAPNMKRPPEIYINPSIVKNSPLESLSPMGRQLYDYYRDRLCTVVSSAPKHENMYLNTFLPMAHADISVLYGILAWSAFHLGGPRMEKQGNFYIQKAIERFSKKPILSSEGDNFYKDVVEEIDVDDPVLNEEKLYDQSNSETISTLSPDDLLNMRLASFLILCGVEICKGDVSRWSKYLNYGAELIKHKGGISKFNGSKDEHFLATNYAYHDITSASVASQRNLHFDLNEYEEMWVASNQMGFVDPLHGISSPIFKIIAEINKLAMDSRIMLRRSTHIIDDDSGEEFSGSDDEDEDGAGQDGGIRLDESPAVIERQQTGQDETGKSPESTTSSSQGWYQKHIKENLRGTTYSSVPEIYDEVMAKVYKIDSKLNTARPNQEVLGDIKSSDLELQLTMFECFQLTAKIHLRQSVMRINSSSLEIQCLLSQLVKSLDVLLGSSVEACLCFPLFIAGMNCINLKDQRQINKRLDEFIKRYRWMNVKRCQIVMTQVWKMNHGGDKCIDWYEIVRKLGWDLSFA